MGAFLDPELADADGLVGIGGDLKPRRLLDAYRRGIFPFFDQDSPILWWSPDPRAILELDRLHISRRLARTIRSSKFQVTINKDFPGVIRGCARHGPGEGDGVWITDAMIDAYSELHRLGHAHSVEVWRNGLLAGGLYGVAVGGLFAGESMFHRVTDASKVALAATVRRLSERGFTLMDVQFLTDHTVRMGASEIPRSEYLRRLRSAVKLPVTFA